MRHTVTKLFTRLGRDVKQRSPHPLSPQTLPVLLHRGGDVVTVGDPGRRPARQHGAHLLGNTLLHCIVRSDTPHCTVLDLAAERELRRAAVLLAAASALGHQPGGAVAPRLLVVDCTKVVPNLYKHNTNHMLVDLCGG